MALYKESILNKIKDDLTGRNQNWDKIDDHMSAFMAHGESGAGFHNSIFRGKSLGSAVTPEQYAAISGGTFDDMYIGDYWTIGGVTYRIAAFNYFYNCGDTALTQNHVTLVPDAMLYTHVMNNTDITAGGYIGSKMYEEGLDAAKTTIKNAFSGHVVKHRQFLCNAVTDGEASAGEWVDSEVELMNEVMVYGSVVNGHATYGLYNVGICKSQLPLFTYRHDLIGSRQTCWLRDVASASNFANVSDNGFALLRNASNVDGVRPAFSIS